LHLLRNPRVRPLVYSRRRARRLFAVRQLGGPASLAKRGVAGVAKMQRLIRYRLAVLACLALDVAFVELDRRLEGHAMRHDARLPRIEEQEWTLVQIGGARAQPDGNSFEMMIIARTPRAFALDEGRFDACKYDRQTD
jgi:hypothetical protein